MDQYIIFGGGSFLGCIFDLIHAQNGQVAKIYQNIPEVLKHRELSIRDRVSLLGYDVEIYDSLDSFEPADGYKYVLGFPTVQKYKLLDKLKGKFGITLTSLIHPTAYIGSNVHIGEGVTLLPNVIIDTNAYLDDFCVVNKAAVIGHEAKIGKYSLIAPSATIAGSSTIGDKCFIGMNSCILDGKMIGDWTIIGAGSVVTKDIEEGVVALGAPAKIIKNNDEINFEKYLAKKEYHITDNSDVSMGLSYHS